MGGEKSVSEDVRGNVKCSSISLLGKPEGFGGERSTEMVTKFFFNYFFLVDGGVESAYG